MSVVIGVVWVMVAPFLFYVGYRMGRRHERVELAAAIRNIEEAQAAAQSVRPYQTPDRIQVLNAMRGMGWRP